MIVVSKYHRIKKNLKKCTLKPQSCNLILLQIESWRSGTLSKNTGKKNILEFFLKRIIFISRLFVERKKSSRQFNNISSILMKANVMQANFFEGKMICRRNVMQAKCYKVKMLYRLNVMYAKCYVGKMLCRQNVLQAKCYVCEMLCR